MKKKVKEELDLSVEEVEPPASKKEIKEILKKLKENDRFSIAYYIAEQSREIDELMREKEKLTRDKERLIDLLLKEHWFIMTNQMLKDSESYNNTYNKTFDFLYSMEKIKK